ncbi:unnamed protein product [Pleuronectes platessa]|uniref:Uncharacterized protein n=1 Tax=Pleuronectes platessa TaxID=8262 RepID=A0A9N7V4Z3_PLEPL|nr:unnamed protein product [Pleuronectes platessa]
MGLPLSGDASIGRLRKAEDKLAPIRIHSLQSFIPREQLAALEGPAEMGRYGKVTLADLGRKEVDAIQWVAAVPSPSHRARLSGCEPVAVADSTDVLIEGGMVVR